MASNPARVERVTNQRAEIARLTAELAEMTRRRDEWRAKAEGYDAVRLALREATRDPGERNFSRVVWAGIAADEKKRADDAEAEIARLTAAHDTVCGALAQAIVERDDALTRLAGALSYPNEGPWGVNSDDFGAVARAALEAEQ